MARRYKGKRAQGSKCTAVEGHKGERVQEQEGT